MSMFEGKNKDTMTSFESDEEISLDFDRARPQPAPREKSTKGRMLAAVSVIVLAAVAGGYLFMPDTPVQPLHVAAKPAPVAPAMPEAVDADAALASAMADLATAPAEAGKMSDISAASGAPADAPAADPVTDPAADMAAAALASADAEAQKIAPEIITPDMAAVPPVVPVDAAVPDMPVDAAVAAPVMPASDMQAAEASATPAVETPAAPVVAPKADIKPVVAPVAEADLPPPPQEPVVKAQAPVVKPAPSVVSGTVVSPGEAAIVQNSQVLDHLTAPAGTIVSSGPAADAMMPRVAVVRDVPSQYLVVKKTHGETEIDSRLTAARQALSQGNDRAAAQLFTDLLKDYPKDARIHMGRAVALQRIGQTDRAIAAYEDVLNANPRNLEALTNMLGLIKLQNPALAVEKLSDLRETYPDNGDITTQLGLAYAASGNYDDALRYLDIAEALQPGDANVIYNKAVLYDKMGRLGEAAELYRHILRMSSDGTLEAGFNTDAIKRRLGNMR